MESIAATSSAGALEGHRLQSSRAFSNYSGIRRDHAQLQDLLCGRFDLRFLLRQRQTVSGYWGHFVGDGHH